MKTRKEAGKALYIVLLFAMLAAACGPSQEELAQTVVAQTSVARASTDTAAAQTQAVLDAAATGTQRVNDEATATQGAKETATAQRESEDQTATAEAVLAATQTADALVSQIGEVLADYDLTTEGGRVGWIQEEPVEIHITGPSGWLYIGDGFEVIADGQSFSNFVIHYKVEWTTVGALAGCGLIFRSGPDIKEDKQYQLFTWRFSGLPGWEVEYWEFGVFTSVLPPGLRFNSAINLEDGSTNEYVLVVNGTLVTIYANGTRLSNVTISKLSEGVLAYVAVEQSGEATCTFTDGWVWVLDE